MAETSSVPRADASPQGWWRLSPLANHFPSLHGLRVLAIIGVIQVHLTLEFAGAKLGVAEVASQFSVGLWFCMDCFFILSGFLIGSLLIHEGGVLSPRKLGRFYARRSFRIFPQYYLVLTLIVLTTTLNATQWRCLPYEYLYLTNYSLVNGGDAVMPWGWSLAVEEHFYLAVPFLLGLLALIKSVRGRLVLLGLLWLVGPAARWMTWRVLGYDGNDMILTSYIWTHTRSDILVAGIFIAVIQRHYAEEVKALWARQWARIVGALLVIACLLFLVFGRFAFDPPEWYAVFAWGSVTSVMYVLMVTWLINYDGRIARALGHDGFRRMATLGYGIYLLHIPVLRIFVVPAMAVSIHRGLLPPGIAWWLGLTLAFFISMAFSYLLHLAVDKPMLLLRDRWAP